MDCKWQMAHKAQMAKKPKDKQHVKKLTTWRVLNNRRDLEDSFRWIFLWRGRPVGIVKWLRFVLFDGVRYGRLCAGAVQYFSGQ